MNALSFSATMSPSQYLEVEQRSPIRHEYIGGRIHAMAGGTREHASLIFNLAREVGSGLKGSRCKGAVSEQRVRIENSGEAFYPDVLIHCPPSRYHEQDRDGLLNPGAIFEVLSPSTEDRDRTVKFELYKTIPELTDYVLVYSNRVRMEHYQRDADNKWFVATYNWRRESLVLANFNLVVPLGDIYEDLELPEGMVLVQQEF